MRRRTRRRAAADLDAVDIWFAFSSDSAEWHALSEVAQLEALLALSDIDGEWTRRRGRLLTLAVEHGWTRPLFGEIAEHRLWNGHPGQRERIEQWEQREGLTFPREWLDASDAAAWGWAVTLPDDADK